MGVGGTVGGKLAQELPLEVLILMLERRVRAKGITETQTHPTFLGVGLDQRRIVGAGLLGPPAKGRSSSRKPARP